MRVRLWVVGLIAGLALGSFTCKDGTTKPDDYTLNPYLKEIKRTKFKQSPNYFMAVWRVKSIYAVEILCQFTLDDHYNVLRDTILLNPDSHLGEYVFWTYIDGNADGTKLLLVKSKYGDVSCGALYEYDVQTGQVQLLYDKSRNISSARYYPRDENKIIFYSYGDDNFTGAGYYLFDKTIVHDSLLFSYLSSAGPSEMLNGFDIHPNGDTLLIPISQSTRLYDRPPKLGLIALKQNKLDTLSIDFNFSVNRTGLWVRYNRDASKILYCCFPRGAYSETVSDNSEVGVIDVLALSKKLLDVNTQVGAYHESIQLAPTWSPDEKAIVFGSGEITLEGAAGKRRLYILTQLN